MATGLTPVSESLPLGVASRHIDVVLVGDFNPAIFVPLWFETHGILPEDSAASAEDVVVTGVVTRFTAGDVFVQVSRESLLMRMSQPGGSRTLRDLTLQTLRLLSHTPVVEVQIIRHWHLAPDAPPRWEELLPLARWAGENEDASLVELTVSVRQKDAAGETICSVEPSDVPDGVVHLVVANRHDFTGDDPAPVGVAAAVHVLDQRWEAASALATTAAARTLEVLIPGAKVEADW